MRTRYMVYIGTILSALSLQTTAVSADETKENENQSEQTTESTSVIQSQKDNSKTDINNEENLSKNSSAKIVLEIPSILIIEQLYIINRFKQMMANKLIHII